MTLRTDDELDQALTELAKAEGVSKQEVVRRAVLARSETLRHVERDPTRRHPGRRTRDASRSAGVGVSEIVFLTLEDLLHSPLPGAGPVRDVGLLDSGAARAGPRSSVRTRIPR